VLLGLAAGWLLIVPLVGRSSSYDVPIRSGAATVLYFDLEPGEKIRCEWGSGGWVTVMISRGGSRNLASDTGATGSVEHVAESAGEYWVHVSGNVPTVRITVTVSGGGGAKTAAGALALVGALAGVAAILHIWRSRDPRDPGPLGEGGRRIAEGTPRGSWVTVYRRR
jgi:hypothetical protein